MRYDRLPSAARRPRTSELADPQLDPQPAAVRRHAPADEPPSVAGADTGPRRPDIALWGLR
jgi:hypothetical protein